MPKELPPFDDEGFLNVFVETPKDSRNKFKWEAERKVWRLSKVLPSGLVFPFDFGYISGTLGEDGDALDILLLMDEPAFPGCLVITRLLGGICAEQLEDGKCVRNDRLIGVANESQRHQNVEKLEDLSEDRLREIEDFFRFYNSANDREFKILGRMNAKQAHKIVKECAKRLKH